VGKSKVILKKKMPTIKKEERFCSIADAVAVVETFIEQEQGRKARVQRRDDEEGALNPSGAPSDDASQNQNMVIMECENSPECKWFVRLSFIKSEKKWKISSMNLAHHRTQCAQSTIRLSETGSTTGNENTFQRMITEEVSSNAFASNGSLSSNISVGMVYVGWKDAIAAVRALGQQTGRRVFSEKSTKLMHLGKEITARRALCQNYRNSNCPWGVTFEESTDEEEQYTVIDIYLSHSKECLDTCNFSARKTPSANKASSTSMTNEDPIAVNADNTGALLTNDFSKYQLTHEMRWSSGKDATKAISDFALLLQRKRAKLCKKNNGGSNKKYVCSDLNCLWFVQLVKGWKSKNWKISAMNLKHSDNCIGEAKPTARQLAEMRFFRQAVITHSKSTGKLLTDNFLSNSDTGIKIPRGMAYRAQRLVVASSTDDLTESYKFIPSLLDSFGKKNPGSTLTYEKDDQGHFTRLFIMPNANTLSLLGMQQVFGIKIISYDNVSYHGCLVLLISKDGNLKNQVIGFALVPNAEMEHMKWFLALTKAGGVRYEGCPIYVSHTENGLLRAIAHEARNAKVMYCVQSLIDEMNRDKNVPTLGALEDLIWDMQRQETEEGFLKVLNQLEGLNMPAATFVRAVHPKNWAYYLNRTIRLYKWASTCAEEALQGSEVQSSDEAPFDLVYSFLAFLMDSVFKKSQLATKLLAENPPLTPGADALYRQELQESELYTVRLCDEQVAFTWRTGARPKITHRVDLSMRTCTCGQMYQLGIPCCHFIAVTLHFGNDANLMDAFDSIYKAATYAEVNRNLRMEIPAAEDLHKDPTILPALSSKGTKYKKRGRTNVEGMNGNTISNGLILVQGTSKTPRLDFDGLTELV
jgi:hypothetical protein